MSEEKNVDNDPTIKYEEPGELLEAEGISKEDKIRLLKEWELTIRQMQVAEEENMTSGPDANLQDVLDALEKLGVDPYDSGASKT